MQTNKISVKNVIIIRFSICEVWLPPTRSKFNQNVPLDCKKNNFTMVRLEIFNFLLHFTNRKSRSTVIWIRILYYPFSHTFGRFVINLSLYIPFIYSIMILRLWLYLQIDLIIYHLHFKAECDECSMIRCILHVKPKI